MCLPCSGFSDTDALIITWWGENKQRAVISLRGGGVRSHPGGSRLNQLLIKLAAWQLAEQLHGNQASMGPHVEVLTHSKLTQKARQTESLEFNRGIISTAETFHKVFGQPVNIMPRLKKSKITNFKFEENNSTTQSALSCMTRRSSREPDTNTQI